MSGRDLLPAALFFLGFVGLHQAAWLGVRHYADRRLSQRRLRAHSAPSPSALAAIAAMLAGLALLSMMVVAEQAYMLDEAIASMVEPLRFPALIPLFGWITLFGNTEALIAIFLITSVVMALRGLRREIATLWIVWLGAYGTTWVLKHVIDRPRPEFIFDIMAYTPSFPSAHATGSISLFGILAYLAVREEPELRRRFEIVFWTTALIGLVSFSRIYVAVHHGSDVVAGLLVGGSWLLAGIVITRWGQSANGENGTNRT